MFNRWYKLINTDPNVAVRVLTPPVMATMRQLTLHTWALAGNELVYAQQPTFGRTKPDGVLEALGKLAALVQVLPLHLGQPYPPPRGFERYSPVEVVASGAFDRCDPQPVDRSSW